MRGISYTIISAAIVLLSFARAELRAETPGQLPRMLRDKGYETAFFCGSESGSMGFGAYARSAGTERLYARAG